MKELNLPECYLSQVSNPVGLPVPNSPKSGTNLWRESNPRLRDHRQLDHSPTEDDALSLPRRDFVDLRGYDPRKFDCKSNVTPTSQAHMPNEGLEPSTISL